VELEASMYIIYNSIIMISFNKMAKTTHSLSKGIIRNISRWKTTTLTLTMTSTSTSTTTTTTLNRCRHSRQCCKLLSQSKRQVLIDMTIIGRELKGRRCWQTAIMLGTIQDTCITFTALSSNASTLRGIRRRFIPIYKRKKKSQQKSQSKSKLKRKLTLVVYRYARVLSKGGYSWSS
jgi:hypothetical protein